ncbi:MAG: hypothetical protein HXY25_08015 [Alphaproteobacteria bacterium]|nr:hypothetical protein [Alphaproteobacteria bacterium]
MRGGRLAMAACLAALLAAGPAVPRTVPPDRELYFEVTRNGAPFGHHHARFFEEGAALRVETAVALKVKVAFVTVFRYTLDTQEEWQDGRLVAIRSQADDNGNAVRMSGTADGGGLSVTTSRGESLRAPADIVPTTYWNKALTEAELVLNSQNGQLLEVTVERIGPETIRARGEEITATRYRLSGGLDLDLWYDEAGIWVRSAFTARGAEVVFELLPGAPG